MPSTANFLTNIALAKEKIASTDAILVGAGAGLSTAAGLIYDGEEFRKNFADFIAKYHFPNLYYGGFGPFENDQEMWAYWSRFIAMISGSTSWPRSLLAFKAAWMIAVACIR